MSSAIVCSDVSFGWSDGTVVLRDLDVTFGTGRTGLIGVNGSGKSTLLRLIAGELRPSAGTVSVAGTTGHLPQDLPRAGFRDVADLLGITAARAALHAIERGSAAEEDFTVLGDGWDVEERARAELDRLGLAEVGLDRPVTALSGGEVALAGLAALLLRRPDVLLLDEPTNDLDLAARHRLYEAVEAWTGVLVVVTHDRELLERVDALADLRDGAVRSFGGTLSEYEEVLDVEQAAAERTVRAAGTDLRRQRRELADAHVKLSRRVRYGKKMYENKREPKIVMGTRKRQAQVSAGKHRIMHEERLQDARDRLAEAEETVRRDTEIRISLPGTRVPAGRTVLTIEDLDLVVRGPERIALIGANGSGKTTLLRTIVSEAPGVRVGVEGVGYLPQRLDVLDDSLSLVDNVRAAAPKVPVNQIRAGLARFLFTGTRADRPAAQLSGGERFRAVLATLLLADPPPRLLLLDEPTNNLDLPSVARLAQSLRAYQGAFIVAGHDLPFLQALGITRWLHITPGTPPTQKPPPRPPKTPPGTAARPPGGRREKPQYWG